MPFLKPIECNASIYYGAYITIEELTRAKRARKFSGTIKQFINSFNLELLPIGDEKRSQEYLIGTRLDYYHNFLGIKLKYDDNDKLYLEHFNGSIPTIKLSIEQENEIKKKLLMMGIMSFCDYFFFHTYKANRV